MDDGQPLSGITVIEICHSVAGPYGGQILADLGAEVIKVESPETGDYARDWGPPYWYGAATVFQALNRNKLGVTVDFRDPGQLAALKALILERADVVLQNLRPGAIDKYGLGGEQLLREKPSLIYCNLGAFGAVGPMREKPGYDPLMQACGGLMSVTGEERGEPVRVGTAIIDMGSGMWLANGVLAALYRRAVTGRGGLVETSLYETALGWVMQHIAGYLASGEIRKRMGSGTAEIVPHQAFPTSDGYVMVAAGNDGLFRRLAAELGHPEWAEDLRFASNGKRVVNRREIVELLTAEFRCAGTMEWLARLDRVGVPAAPIQSVAEVVEDPQTLALEIIRKVPDREMALVGLPLSFDRVRPPLRQAAPALGEHNEQIFGTPRSLRSEGKSDQS